MYDLLPNQPLKETAVSAPGNIYAAFAEYQQLLYTATRELSALSRIDWDEDED